MIRRPKLPTSPALRRLMVDAGYKALIESLMPNPEDSPKDFLQLLNSTPEFRAALWTTYETMFELAFANDVDALTATTGQNVDLTAEEIGRALRDMELEWRRQQGIKMQVSAQRAIQSPDWQEMMPSERHQQKINTKYTLGPDGRVLDWEYQDAYGVERERIKQHNAIVAHENRDNFTREAERIAKGQCIADYDEERKASLAVALKDCPCFMCRERNAK